MFRPWKNVPAIICLRNYFPPKFPTSFFLPSSFSSLSIYSSLVSGVNCFSGIAKLPRSWLLVKSKINEFFLFLHDLKILLKSYWFCKACNIIMEILTIYKIIYLSIQFRKPHDSFIRSNLYFTPPYLAQRPYVQTSVKSNYLQVFLWYSSPFDTKHKYRIYKYP